VAVTFVCVVIRVALHSPPPCRCMRLRRPTDDQGMRETGRGEPGREQRA
jgi:hypothetical protein